MNHGLFEEKVKCDENHVYSDNEGNEYISFSKLYDLICPPFDSGVSRFVAKAKGVTQEEILGEWNDKRDNGTRIDDALTLYFETGLIKEENNDIKDLILSVAGEYKKHKRGFSQIIVYSEKHRTAGTSDKTFLFTYMKDSAFGKSDFKCFEKDDLFKRRGWLNAPFEHLPNTKYTKIAFQLSYYAYHFEELTRRKCNELFIHVINPATQTHQKVYCPYMKHDVKLLLETYKPQIDLLLNKTKEEAF